MSKTLLLVFLCSVSSAGALFTPIAPWLLPRSLRVGKRSTRLSMGWFDFKPIHGSGSGGSSKELDEQWEAQQEILRSRRGEFSKEHLQQKYKGGGPNHLELHAKQVAQKHAEHLAFQEHTFVDVKDEKILHRNKKVATKKVAVQKQQYKSKPKFKLPWER